MNEVVWVDIILLLLVTITAGAVVTVRDLISVTMLAGIYSLLMSLVWANLLAMDVAFTEAAVGAGISTVLFLGALVYTGTDEKPTRGLHWPALIVVILTGGALVYGTLDMPEFGDPTAVSNRYLSPEYIHQTVGKEGSVAAHENDFGHHVPNLATAVLADYRSFDTLFETAVIFTAGVCVILLLRHPRRATRRPGETVRGEPDAAGTGAGS